MHCQLERSASPASSASTAERLGVLLGREVIDDRDRVGVVCASIEFVTCGAVLPANGPVLVRLTCGCLGCNKELPYFQELHAAYQDKGLTSLAVFREPDAKVEAYVKEKKLNMLYAVDTKGEAWNVFETKTMPTNFLIEKGGKIVAVAAGCDPSGLLAKNFSAASGSLSRRCSSAPRMRTPSVAGKATS